MGSDALEEGGHGCVYVSSPLSGVPSRKNTMRLIRMLLLYSQRTSLPGVGEIGGSEQEKYGFRLHRGDGV